VAEVRGATSTRSSCRRSPAEPEFHQAEREVFDTISPVIDRHPEQVRDPEQADRRRLELPRGAQPLERAAPLGELIEHGLQRGEVMRPRLQHGSVLEVVEQGQGTWVRTSAILTSPTTRRRCSTARTPPSRP
jgi:hypothetical protein